MPIVNQTRYQPLDDPALVAKLDKRFASEIRQLEKLGFERFQYVREGGEIGLVWAPLMLILMLVNREVIRLRWSRYFLETCFPLLVNDKYATYVTISAMGVGFFTLFVDGAILMSVNTIAMHEGDKTKIRQLADERAFHHFYYKIDILGTWNAHRNKLKDFEEKGYQPVTELTFQGFANMSLRYLEASFGVKVRK